MTNNIEKDIHEKNRFLKEAIKMKKEKTTQFCFFSLSILAGSFKKMNILKTKIKKK